MAKYHSEHMPQAGGMLGEYYLQQELGKGGFAIAYRGIKTATNEPVAVKVLTQEPTTQNIAAFYEEAECTARLNHPNIVKVRGIAPRDARPPHFATALAQGGSLGSLVRNRQSKNEVLPLACTLSVVDQMANALAYLHQLHIVHRDVKPDNMLIAWRDQLTVWLADLGIHKVLKPEESLRPGALAGSPQYIAPEQIHGRGVFASDQYALGITVFLLLTGRLPFTDEKGNVLAILDKHLNEAPPSMVAVARARNVGNRVLGIIGDLEPIVLKAMDKVPANRYHTIMTFATTLKAAADTALQEDHGKLYLGG